MSTDDQNGQQATIQDLFRVITAMRAENAARFDAVDARFNATGARLDSQSGEIAAMRAENAEFRAEVNSKLDAHSGELEAVRKAVDELPTMDSVTGLEDGQIAIKRDTEAVRKEVRQVAAE